MLNRPMITTIATLLAALLLAGTAMAQDVKKYAVMPFEYNGPQKYAYFPKAFQASLNSDLEWVGHAEPAPDSLTEDMKPPKGKGEAINTIRAAGIDYIITGSIDIIGKEATLAMKAFGQDGSFWEGKGQMGIDEITPWLEEQSSAIMGEVFKRPGYSKAEKEAKATDVVDHVAAPTNSAFIQADNMDYQSDKLNPQFRYEGGVENIGRWRSQTLRFSSTGMVVADGDGDGKNEVFLLTNSGVAAYRYNDGKLQMLEEFSMAKNTQYMRLEAADLDRDGVPELIIGTYQSQKRNATEASDGYARSYILTFKGGKFKYLVKNYNRFLGVLRMPPTYLPILAAQKKGDRHLFDTEIREAYIKGDSIELGPKIAIPPYGNVYNMAYLPDEFGYRYVVIDDEHRIKIFSQTLEALWSSDRERYNSSGIGIEVSSRMVGMGPGKVDEHPAVYNVPFRMAVESLVKKGKYEVLVNKDLSIAAQIFQRYRIYTQGEIHSMSWDGVGLNLAWKTRRIKGQVCDIAIVDVNNDGNKQLCVLVNTFPGAASFSKRKTIVLAYDLNM